MALVCLTSASGSPGVTSTAVGLAFCWPRPVLLVEADPTGGSGILAGFLKGTASYDGGLIELALSPRAPTDALREVARPLSPQVSLVAGTRSHGQAMALRGVWEPLATALVDLEASGRDVIVDAGRVGLVGTPDPLLESADATLLLTRTNLPSISAARSWAETALQPAAGWRHPGLVLIGEGKPYRDTEVAKVLRMPVVADLPDDPEAAAVYHRGATPPRHFDSGPYARGLQALAQSVQAHVARGRFALVQEATQ
ncbi:hypothetical protein ASC77_23540 [Nocardioides sp. Root1257]|uniref:MinD/ParA family ATP-binding protein n=1 Tax=unclassified Nocardioides TaxID=2615069 RepID=UPI0006FBFFD7|nr:MULTISPECIES: hypothetical protein [unclassified Nocardioides]KQW42704.1 hypothetical protein ASC77_23540 [Nocardioides sp. Root1257]KRC39962.1 hypothetical protein ASE24_23335 [Nocardioides sp. Root224]